MSPVEYETLKMIISRDHIGGEHSNCGMLNSTGSVSDPLKVNAILHLYEIGYIAIYNCPFTNRSKHYISSPDGRIACSAYRADD